jgi:hypothetical protein
MRTCRVAASEVLWFQACPLRHPSEHAWPDLLGVVECEHNVFPTVPCQHLVRGPAFSLHPPAYPLARSSVRAFTDPQALMRDASRGLGEQGCQVRHVLAVVQPVGDNS